MIEILMVFFWFLAIPFQTTEEVLNSSRYTVFHAVICLIIFIVGFVLGLWVFIGASVLFKVLALIVVYILGLVTSIGALSEGTIEWKWMLSLFLSSFFLSPFLHWLWMLR